MSLSGCYVLSPETKLTISNHANADDNYYIQIRFHALYEYEGVYFLDDPYYSLHINNGGFIPLMEHPGSPNYGGLVELRPSESVTISLFEYAIIRDYYTGEEFVTYDLLVLVPELYDPDTELCYQVYYGFAY